MQPTLSMRDITKHYDAIAALTDVSFDVLPGEVHALLGENGAGKSTLMNVASGATAPDSGTIVFDGSPVEHLTPAMAQELGIAIVHQHPALLPDMTVAENIRVAVGREHLRRRDPDATKAMRSLLDDVHFLGHLEDRVSSLSVARRHLLELAKAFAVSPRLLILDEPTAPLSQDSVELLFTAVRKLAADGHGHRLHHAPAGRGARDRRSRHRPARRHAARDLRGQGHLGRRPARHDHRAHARGHLPAEARARRRRGAAAAGRRAERARLREHLVQRARRARSWASPAWSATASRRSCARWPGASRRPDRSTSAASELSRRALLESAAYMPADRLTEGLMIDLNVRENAAMTALDRFTVGPVRQPAPRGRRRRARARPSWRSRRRRSRRPSRRSPAATSRRS